MKRLHLACGCAAFAAAAMGAVSGPAAADVTLTYQQTAQVSGAATASPSRTIVLSFHGNEARMEISGGPELLYDGKEGTIETLHDAAKTYDMSFVSQLLQAGDPADAGPGVTTETHLDLRQTGHVQVLAGVTAHQYLVVGSITSSRPQPRTRGGFGGRHRGGGGGFPGGFPLSGNAGLSQNDGGMDGGEGGSRERGALPQYSIGGEMWLSDAVKLPAEKNATDLPAVQIAAADAGPFLKPLTDALNNKKEIVLMARITVTRTMPAAGGAVDAFGGVMDAGGASGPGTMTTATTLTVQSISTLPLGADVFEAPSRYALVPAPIEPFDPGLPRTAQPASR